MSYVYRERERDRDWDDSRPVTIKRYVIPSEDDRERSREFVMRRDDSYTGDRELVIRRKTEREVDHDDRRYDRDYERDYYEREYSEPSAHRHYSRSVDYLERPPLPPSAPVVIREQPIIVHEARNVYVNSRETEYDLVRRSDTEDEPYYSSRRRDRDYDERRSRRELSPGDSVSQATRHRSDRDQDYSSDDSMVYIRKETETRGNYDPDHPHHRRHMAEGALAAAGAAELFRSHRKKSGEDVSHGVGRLGKTVGAGALGAVAVNAASHARDYYRSKSRHRSRSIDDDHRSHRHSHHDRGRRSRSRSQSNSHTRHLIELGLGAAAVAGAVAVMKNKKDKDERRSRSRTRSKSRGRGLSTARSEPDEARSASQRRKHMAGAGLAGAAVAGLVERHRSRSRARKGERSHSRIRQVLPVLAAGLGTAAATGFYEKKKAEKDAAKEGVSRDGRRSRSRSQSAAPVGMYPDPSRTSAGLIEYGNDPVAGSIPAEHYYGQPTSPGGPYYSDGAEYGSRRHSRTRNLSGSDSGSDGEGRHRRRSKHRKHRSRSRDIAGAALGATGLGYAAHKYSQRKDRKQAEKEGRYVDDDHRDPYEEGYDPEPYPPSPHPAGGPPPDPRYYPNGTYFPPPPGSTPNLGAATAPYNPPDYPPPPGAAPPPQPYSYGAGQAPEQYAPRPRRADENVSSTPSTDQYTTRDGLDRNGKPSRRRSQSVSQPMQSKSVSFDLDPETKSDTGYETDDSDATIDGHNDHHRHNHRRRHHRHHRRRHSSSVPRSPMPYPSSSSSHHHHHHSSSSSRHSSNAKNQPENKSSSTDSDSTIDLPDRFDSQGRPLTQRGVEDPAAAKIEEMINKFSKILF
ncbi:hypothetical protein N7510_008745 [Penicillium lagena]|uniref:uncharacterized protein n=1 Tax=Penicillium lagena TaxID=94218 RepID=UPI002540C85F|nr:uncharacterized protein N7510_008745 [Penicillium lagena]KAJ5605964.1 hypothetical protein N7510_008745 [Penicillium lagena]